MTDLLPALSKKYRIFLITKVPDGDGSEQHKKAKKLIQNLIDTEAI
jgi:hypothetical protein